MAQWTRVQGLPGVRDLYGPHFPMEIRHFFAAWLESQPLASVNEADEAQRPFCQTFMETLLRQLRSKIDELSAGASDMFLLRLRMEEIYREFEKKYMDDPVGLVHVIKSCLARENELLERSQPAAAAVVTPILGPDEEALRELAALNKLLGETEEQLKLLQSEQAQFVAQYQELTRLQSSKDGGGSSADARKRSDSTRSRADHLERQLSDDGTKILKARKHLMVAFQEALRALEAHLVAFVADKLAPWRRHQCLGQLNEDDQARQLDTFQSECEQMAVALIAVRDQLRRLLSLQDHLSLKSDTDQVDTHVPTSLLSQCQHVLRSLVQQTFVLEKQPPQVLKTQTKFTATGRLLAGSKIGVFGQLPEVRATLVNEQQARQLSFWTKDAQVNPGSVTQMLDGLANSTGTLQNDRKSFEYSKDTQSLKSPFKSLSLKKIKRRDTKTDEAVTEEKFALLLHTSVSIGDAPIHIYTYSIPLVVIVHGNQHAKAMATIVWDNYFGERNREPFLVPDAVPWSKMAAALSSHFGICNHAFLKDTDLQHLRQRTSGTNGDGTVTWAAFNREAMPGRPFTFWEWFFGAEEIVKRHLHTLWSEGLIAGFVSKRDAETWLSACEPGTFLLRFSNSQIGGISVAWVSAMNEEGTSTRKVWHLQPWFAKDFAIRPISDRLGDLTHLLRFHPNKPKEDALRKHYTGYYAQGAVGDYVRTSISATILAVGPAARLVGEVPTAFLGPLVKDEALEALEGGGGWTDDGGLVSQPPTKIARTSAVGGARALEAMARAAQHLASGRGGYSAGGAAASASGRGGGARRSPDDDGDSNDDDENNDDEDG